MKTSNGFTAMTAAEFGAWIKAQKVTRAITRIQMHHTAQPNYKTWNGKPDAFYWQNSMKNYHVNANGWADIAQQFTICPDGTIITGRSLNMAPAGITGANTGAICIENIGNFDTDTMTGAQSEAIVTVAAELLKRFMLSTAAITYHAWWTASGTHLGTYIPGRSAKTCPGGKFFGGNTKAAYAAYLEPKIASAMTGAAAVNITEYTDPEAIAWELNYRGIVEDKQGLIDAVAAEPNGRLYWLARKICHAIRKLNGKAESVRVAEYKDPEAIAWDLHYRGIVEDMQGMINALKAEPNGRIYWLARKGLNYLRRRD